MIRLNAKKYVIIAAVISLLLIFHYLKILTPLESFLSQALKPVARIFYLSGSAISRTYYDKTAAADAAEKLKQAQADITRLTVENAKLKFLQDENLALRKLLNFLDESSGRYVMANIISRGGLSGDPSGSQTVVLDKGLKHGIIPGLAVIGSEILGTSSQGVIIGKITSVKDNISQACLITSKNCKLAASILGRTKTSGIVQGELGLVVKMEFIPQTENIKAGDLAATSGLEQYIARGLVIGRVARVAKENNEVWQSAVIEPQISLDDLSLAAVLLP